MLQLGIIGQPLTHSLSPLLQAQLMQLTGVAGEYRAYELAVPELDDKLSQLMQQGIRGLNVTIPHKVSVMPLLDWISPEAELAGAVNTLVFEDAPPYKKGYNTDIQGFLRGLPSHFLDQLPESHILILGAGGSARAVLAGLIQMGAATISLAIRDPQKAVALLSNAEVIKQTYRVSTEINTLSLHSLPSLESFQGLINTTPVGMWPETRQSPLPLLLLETLPAGALVYDLIYRPQATQLLQAANHYGHHTISGLDMLIYQGICAFELWQPKPVPENAMPILKQQLQQVLAQTAS